MNSKLEALSRLAESRDEMDRINLIADLEEQGYAAGPVLVHASGATPEQLLASIILTAEDNEVNVPRSIGVIRWCLDQRKLQ